MLYCDPSGVRTHDPQIKSLLLYQLSYGVDLINSVQKYKKKMEFGIFSALKVP